MSARRAALLLALGLAWRAAVAPAAAEAPYREPYRPQFHFTPERNWTNDPNGLVFQDGEFHLFYQHNPQGERWGHMSWGHAVSRDLFRWEHLPLAIPEENGVMAFSGSAVVDGRNTSGFGRDARAPLVAVYTGHHTARPLQDQRLAYSNDRGRSWTRYAGNPVLDIGEKDFRDPKVFWHAPSGRWVMAVAWPEHHQVRLYGSPDLKSWEHLSDFGPAGATAGVWECPDLFPLPVAAKAGEARWVLIVNLNPGGPAGGSGTQYFVGDFDGRRFVAEQTQGAPLWLDHGPDFYAAVSWADLPETDGRRIALAWMSNWAYAAFVPTSPWRGSMTVPRELRLRRTPEGLRVVQQPAREIESLRRGVPRRFEGGTVAEAAAWLSRQIPLPQLLDVEVALAGLTATTSLGLEVRTGPGEATVVSLDGAGRLAVDRRHSGTVGFHPAFAGRYQAPLRLVDGRCRLRLLLDTSSLELFAQDGEATVTALVFPTSAARALRLSSSAAAPSTPAAAAPRVDLLVLHELASAWSVRRTD